MQSDVLMSLLAMDSYNRGYDPGVNGLGGINSRIGHVRVGEDAISLLPAGLAESQGFYAISYQTLGVSGFDYGQQVISFRGTIPINIGRWTARDDWSGASPAGGAIITIASGRTAASDIDHQLRKRSRCQPGRSAPPRSASRPGWHRRRSSTNYATGPVIARSAVCYKVHLREKVGLCDYSYN